MQHNILQRHLFFSLLTGVLVAAGCRNQAGVQLGEAAAQALSTFELEDGFQIALLAAEPLISDPVDMEIDEYGRLYVVEMHGYPLDKSGTGKIKLLTDSDGDGHMDKSTAFAEGLVLPNSIMRWKKGVLVTDAPHVLYLEDTNNDGKADVRDTVLTGFALSNPQHNLNSPLLGMDNWIYLAHEGAVSTEIYKEEFGDEGSEVYFPGKPDGPRLPQNAAGRSVRFRPGQGQLEVLSSETQFGHTFDAWGRYFLVSNADHIYQEMLAAPYFNRNPHLLLPDATQDLSDHGNAAEVFPITQNPEHQLLTDVGVITSACGITAYTGGAFPKPYNENVVFVAEPVSNLIHADRLHEKGASFTASRLHPHQEFLASTDAWFRPVNMYVGPDGALYVVDYYRQIIEHPEWMGDEVIRSGQLYNGSDKGRIYRIAPKGTGPAGWTKGLRIGDLPNEQLVEKLSDANQWWRMNAQRLLLDRGDKSVVPTLIKMTQNRQSPYGRLHALWTLQGLGALQPDLIELALKDPVAGVRENAIRLAELHLAEAPRLHNTLFALQTDSNARVRYQLLCTLGFIATPEAAQVRNKLLFHNLSDSWMQVAALSAATSQTTTLLRAVRDSFRHEVPAYASLMQRLGAILGASAQPATLRRWVQQATAVEQEAGWQASLLQGLAQGLSAANRLALQKEQNRLLQTFFEHPVAAVRKATLALLKATGLHPNAVTKQAMQQAAQIAGNPNRPEEKRVEAIQLLALHNPAPYASLLESLITPGEPLPVQLAALHTLSAVPGMQVPHYLLQQWPKLTPEIQDQALNAFLRDSSSIALLLDALEQGAIQPAAVGWPRTVRLMTQSNIPLRNRARMLLTKNEAAQKKISLAYQTVLSLKGAAEQGRAVYRQHCSSCHQVRGTMGVSFGPDLGTIHNWSAEAIMAHILAPNLSISSGYDLWSVTLKNGDAIQGIIAAETPTTLTLRTAARVERTIRRTDIQTLKALNLSAMPTGVEKQINQQQMADLLAFLKQNK